LGLKNTISAPTRVDHLYIPLPENVITGQVLLIGAAKNEKALKVMYGKYLENMSSQFFEKQSSFTLLNQLGS